MVTNCRFTCESPSELFSNDTVDSTTVFPEKDISAASEEYIESYDDKYIIEDDVAPEIDISAITVRSIFF